MRYHPVNIRCHLFLYGSCRSESSSRWLVLWCRWQISQSDIMFSIFLLISGQFKLSRARFMHEGISRWAAWRHSSASGWHDAKSSTRATLHTKWSATCSSSGMSKVAPLPTFSVPVLASLAEYSTLQFEARGRLQSRLLSCGTLSSILFPMGW